jgi:hypothetical protein
MFLRSMGSGERICFHGLWAANLLSDKALGNPLRAAGDRPLVLP